MARSNVSSQKYQYGKKENQFIEIAHTLNSKDLDPLLVFFHGGHSLDEIIDVHTNDSLRYVWGGRLYPKPLDVYYDEYYKKNDVPRPRRSLP